MNISTSTTPSTSTSTSDTLSTSGNSKLNRSAINVSLRARQLKSWKKLQEWQKENKSDSEPRHCDLQNGRTFQILEYQDVVDQDDIEHFQTATRRIVDDIMRNLFITNPTAIKSDNKQDAARNCLELICKNLYRAQFNSYPFVGVPIDRSVYKTMRIHRTALSDNKGLLYTHKIWITCIEALIKCDMMVNHGHLKKSHSSMMESTDKFQEIYTKDDQICDRNMFRLQKGELDHIRIKEKKSDLSNKKSIPIPINEVKVPLRIYKSNKIIENSMKELSKASVIYNFNIDKVRQDKQMYVLENVYNAYRRGKIRLTKLDRTKLLKLWKNRKKYKEILEVQKILDEIESLRINIIAAIHIMVDDFYDINSNDYGGNYTKSFIRLAALIDRNYDLLDIQDIVDNYERERKNKKFRANTVPAGHVLALYERKRNSTDTQPSRSDGGPPYRPGGRVGRSDTVIDDSNDIHSNEICDSSRGDSVQGDSSQCDSIVRNQDIMNKESNGTVLLYTPIFLQFSLKSLQKTCKFKLFRIGQKSPQCGTENDAQNSAETGTISCQICNEDVYRSFNLVNKKNPFGFGGRRYGYFAQSLPSSERKNIHINGKKCSELDYKSLHPTMLYHLNGIEEIPDNIYYYPKGHPLRKLVKLVGLAAINAKTEAAAIGSLHWDKEKKAQRMPYEVAKLCIQRFKEANPKLLPFIWNKIENVGVTLQNKDSEVMEVILKQLPLSIPIHDSILSTEDPEKIREVMLHAYQKITGKNYEISIE